MTEQEWKAVSQLSENLKHNEILHANLQERFEATVANMNKARKFYLVVSVLLVWDIIATLIK